eukprot:symbB.v1.2.020653.t1/scaffold1748.1/size222129/1
MPTEKEKGAQLLRRANTDGKVQTSKTIHRGRIPKPPFDPWASDSDDDSNANVEVITPAPRRKLPSSKGKSEGGTALSLWGSFLEKDRTRSVNKTKSIVGKPETFEANLPPTEAVRGCARFSRHHNSVELKPFHFVITRLLGATESPGDRASPWSSSRSPRPNPLLPSSRSPS